MHTGTAKILLTQRLRFLQNNNKKPSQIIINLTLKNGFLMKLNYQSQSEETQCLSLWKISLGLKKHPIEIKNSGEFVYNYASWNVI